MVGPRKKKVPAKLSCDHCSEWITRTVGGTRLYPLIRFVYYCKHEDLETQVGCIRKFPYTPKWCPALKTKNNKALHSTPKAEPQCTCHPHDLVYYGCRCK